jgi:hypothetical protein
MNAVVLVRNPYGRKNVIEMTGQRAPMPGIMVVIIEPPLSLFLTQLGNGLHVPFALHVTFRLPPMFV